MDPQWQERFLAGQRGQAFPAQATPEDAMKRLLSETSTFRPFYELLVEKYGLATREEIVAALPGQLAGVNDELLLRGIKKTFRPRLIDRMFKEGSRELEEGESIEVMRRIVRSLGESDQGRFSELWYERFHARRGGAAMQGQVRLKGPGLNRRPDFLDGQTVVEVKSTRGGLGGEDVAQIEDYLRVAKDPGLGSVKAAGGDVVVKKVRVVFTEVEGVRGSMRHLERWFGTYSSELTVEMFLDGRSHQVDNFAALETMLSRP